VCLQKNVFSYVQLRATAEEGRANSARVSILIFYSITGLHVVWRDQANSRGGARELGAAVDPTNAQPQHDIEALDFVQIEGVECVLQVGWAIERGRVCVCVCARACERGRAGAANERERKRERARETRERVRERARERGSERVRKSV
jgi:hypothetical protein